MTEPAPTRPAWRRYLPWFGLVLLAWVLSRLDLRALGAALAGVAPRALCESALLFTANMLLKAFRWQRMLAAQQLALPARVAVPAFLSSQFYGQATLGRVGELYRAEALVERGVPLGRALSSSVYDRLLDLGAVLFVAATFGAAVAGDTRAAAVAAAGMLALSALGLAVLHARRLSALAPVAALRVFLERKRGARGLLGMLGQLVDGLGPLLKPAFLVEATLWTVVSWLLYFAALWQLAMGMGVVATRTLLTAGAALGALSSLLPITVSGLGAREVILMHALALQNVPEERAVALSLLHLSVMTASALLFGLIGVWVRQRQHARGVPPLEGSVEPPAGS
jgi:glycosyltransferase 2 family protein